MRSRVSAAFAAGGRPGPLLAVYGTVKLCHTSPGTRLRDLDQSPEKANSANNGFRVSDAAQVSPSTARFGPARGELGFSRMGAVQSREAFFDAGLDVLSDLGYGGLKLAAVCQRLGVTTGSFYHYFSNWSSYTRQLVTHWQEGMTVTVVEAVQAEPDPRRRIDSLFKAGLKLPYGAEAAIRVWSSICLLYTSPSPRDGLLSRMPSSA